MNIIARKLSIISALVAMIVVVAAGGLSGVPLEFVLMRAGIAFFVVMAGSMVLFKLALKDRDKVAEKDSQEEEE